MCCTRLTANAGPKKVAKNRHLGTIAQLCRAISSQRRQVSTIGKQKLVKQQYLLDVTSQYGELRPLAAEIVSLVWGTPGNFNGFRVLAALLHGTLVVDVSQTLRRWTEGATYIRQGGHHVGHWPTFLALLLLIRCVSFWPWPLTFWSWSVVIHGGSHIQPLHQIEDPMIICLLAVLWNRAGHYIFCRVVSFFFFFFFFLFLFLTTDFILA